MLAIENVSAAINQIAQTTLRKVVGQHGACRVIALDARGHGRGMRPAESFTLEDCADDAAALLDQLGADRVIVVGYSMGGPIGMLLARRHPGRVKALVMQATALEWRDAHERMAWHLLSALEFGLRLGTGTDIIERSAAAAARVPGSSNR